MDARWAILLCVADKNKASFIPPMLLVRTEKLPEGEDWLYELKLDGFRSIAFKTGGKVYLRSRNNKDFNATYPSIVKALAHMPDETVIDGEIVALDEAGRPSFGALQNYGSGNIPIVYYVFDVMVLEGVDVMREPLSRRRELLEQKILPDLVEPIKYSAELDSDLTDLVQSAKKLRLEGLIAKRRDSRYQPGLRTAAWWKMRVNAGQEFVIGGYTLGNPFDALVFGYYEGNRLLYVARTRNGFTPASRQRLFEKFRGLEVRDCPFVNLPEAKSGRWGQGLTKEKMKDCRWLKPVLVAQFEFTEWTPEWHLRHSRFVGLREDKKAKDVGREMVGVQR
jgi:DNA ligase D-like protein (predicted ligase)